MPGFRKSPLALSPLVPSALTQFVFRVFFAAESCKKYPKNRKKQLACELEGDFCEALLCMLDNVEKSCA
jgi:hypothetical protein